jgi:2-methylcitrate dehydratase PrpD
MAVSDWISRTNVAAGKAPLTVKDILESMIMAHEIQVSTYLQPRGAALILGDAGMHGS